jgi:hypothetical protein
MKVQDVEKLHVNKEALRASIERNRQERLKFIDDYAEWMKKTPNSEWSRQQNIILGKNSPKE